MPAIRDNAFSKGLGAWNRAITADNDANWAEQLRILSEVTDLITEDLSVEEITAKIYLNVNHLFDAFQFAVGIYDEEKATITYKGMIEDGKRVPDFSVDSNADNRFASWAIKNEKEIFMNDVDKEYINYLPHKPIPVTGCDPKAAIYVPLKLHNKVVGLIVVRTIHRNVYQQHHLHILKTVGNFVVRAIELTRMSSRPLMNTNGVQQQWTWSEEKNLSSRSGKVLLLLTEREKEVLFLLVSGLSNKAIAEKLFVSAATIKTHTLNIYQKMDVANRTSAIVKAFELGWIFQNPPNGADR